MGAVQATEPEEQRFDVADNVFDVVLQEGQEAQPAGREGLPPDGRLLRNPARQIGYLVGLVAAPARRWRAAGLNESSGHAELAGLQARVPKGGDDDELVALPLGGLAELQVEGLAGRRHHGAVGRASSPVEVPVALVTTVIQSPAPLGEQITQRHLDSFD